MLFSETGTDDAINEAVIYLPLVTEGKKKVALPKVYASFLRVYPDFNYLNVNT